MVFLNFFLFQKSFLKTGNPRLKRNFGFSLFELLISISIIGILTALAVVSFSSIQKKARDARRVEDMKAIQTAAEQFFSTGTYTYPVSTAPADWTVNNQIILQFPKDPKKVGWTGYTYSIGDTYCACAAVENEINGNSSDNACTMGVGDTGSYFCVKSQQ